MGTKGSSIFLINSPSKDTINIPPSSIFESSAYIAAFASENHSTGDKGGHLVFGTAPNNQNDDTTSTEHMRLNQGGKLLIGRTSPEASTKNPILEVDGFISCDGFVDSVVFPFPFL